MTEGLLIFGKGYIPIHDSITDIGYFIQLPYTGKLFCERR